MHQLANELLLLKLSRNADIKELLPALEHAVENQEMTPYAAARKIMEQV
jgi:hypothetical protein